MDRWVGSRLTTWMWRQSLEETVVDAETFVDRYSAEEVCHMVAILPYLGSLKHE